MSGYSQGREVEYKVSGVATRSHTSTAGSHVTGPVLAETRPWRTCSV
jgi:hypothetical protein